MSTPREQLLEILRDLAYDADGRLATTKHEMILDASDAILAIIKGLPAMQGKNFDYQTFFRLLGDYGEACKRYQKDMGSPESSARILRTQNLLTEFVANHTRRQILAELEGK